MGNREKYMLRRFIEWVDSLGDNINPLVLRDVRRASRNFIYPVKLCLYCIAIIFIVIINWNNRESFVETSHIFAWGICGLGMGTACFSILDMSVMFNKDELFLMNGLSPRQYLHAYITISAVNSLFVISLSLPPLTAVQLVGRQGLNLSFWYIIPILAFLLGQTYSLLALSFRAHDTTPGIKCFLTIREQIKRIFLGILLLISFAWIFATWFLFVFLWNDVFKLPLFNLNNQFDLISLYFLFPFVLLVISATAYKLCLNGFKINYKPHYSGYFYNIFIYTILSTCLAVIYFILVLLFR